jgi:ABC-type transporter Mla subunit MlaD
MLFAIGDTVWLALIAVGSIMASGLVSASGLILKEYFDRKRQKAADDRLDKVAAKAATAADKVEKVASKVEIATTEQEHRDNERAQAIQEIKKTGEDTYHLCNSALLAHQRVYREKCEAAAKDTPTAVNLAEAKAARETYIAHKDQQDKRDAQKQMTPAKAPEAP